MAKRTGNARVYLDPPPERGAHPGVQGKIVVDELGVHVEDGAAEWLSVDNESERDDWPMGEWFISEGATTVPWHRVHSIEWDERYALGAEDVAALEHLHSTEEDA